MGDIYIQATGGSDIAIEDKGNPVTSAVTKINFAGAVTVTEPVADEVTVTVTPGSAPVASVFGDVGVVVAQASQYQASLIDNDSINAQGAFVDDALDALDALADQGIADAATADGKAVAAQSDATSAKTKTDRITVTQAVNLDTIESDTATNNAKTSYTDAVAVGLNTTHRTSDGASHSKVTANESAIAALGTAAAEDHGIAIGNIPRLGNVGGNAGFVAGIDASLLENLPSGSPIATQDDDVEILANTTTYNFTGDGIEAAVDGTDPNQVNVTVAPGAAPIASVFTRTGAVIAAASDYDASQVDNDSGVLGGTGTVAGALDQLDTDLGSHTHDTLANVAQDRLLGRLTAGSGLSEELTATQARTLLNVADGATASGTMGQGEWVFAAFAITTVAPGQFVSNNSDLSLITQIQIHQTPNAGGVLDTLLSGMGAGDFLYFQLASDPKTTGLLLEVNAAPTDAGSGNLLFGDVTSRSSYGTWTGAPHTLQIERVGSRTIGDVTAAAALPVDEIVTGDTAAKGVKTSGIAASDIGSNTTHRQLVADNPHGVSHENILGGTLTRLKQVISGELITEQSNEINTLQAEAAPADDDLFIMEQAIDGAKRSVRSDALPGGTHAAIVDGNPHGVSHENINSGTLTSLKQKIAGELVTERANELNNAIAFPLDSAPADDDLFLMEKAIGGAKRAVKSSDLSGGAHAAIVDGNPHGVSHENILAGTLTSLKQKISGVLVTEQANELSTLTPEASPAADDLFIMEQGIDGTKRSVRSDALPGGTHAAIIDGNPHGVSHANILPGTLTTLKQKISGALVTEQANELNNAIAFPDDPNPALGDRLVLEKAIGGTKRSVTLANLPGGAEVNDLTAAVTWANIPDANVPESSVTQHEAALTVTESQISDLSHVDATKLPLAGGALTGPVTTSSTIVHPDTDHPGIGSVALGLGDHLSDTTAHNASAIVNVPGNGIAAITVQGAITELAQEKYNNPTGTPDTTKYLRDDNTWQALPAGAPPEYKAPVRVATTAPTGSGLGLENGDVIDGVTLVTGDRVLLKDGTSPSIGTYTYDDTAGIPNANGEAQPNNNDGVSVSSINYFDINAAGVDQSTVFADLRVGDQIQLNTLAYIVGGPNAIAPVDNGTYWTIAVSYRPSTSETFPVTQITQMTMGIFNGIFIVPASGAAALAPDFATASGQASAHVLVQEGGANGKRTFVCTNSAGSDVVGTDRLVFEQPRVNAYANGIGAFKPSGETTSSNADNGHFNSTVNLATAAAGNFGLRFSGKTFGRDWGFASGSPIKVQSLISGQGGPGSHIILRQQDDPSKVAFYRNNAPPDVITSGGLDDDTRFNDITYLGATFTNFDATKLYELVISPASPSAVFSGSAVITPTGTVDFARLWSWPNGTSPQNWAWINTDFNNTAPTTALYDHTGIVMPADGVVINYYVQAYAQNGVSLSLKPNLTRIRPVEGAGTVTNTAMNNTALIEDLVATGFDMNALNLTPDGTNSGQLVETTFQRGDKLLVSIMEMINTGTVTSVKIEWGIKVVFVDAIPVGEAPGD